MRKIDRINELLKSNGKNYKYLSDAIGISASAVSQWVALKTEPSNRNLKKIADHFGVDVLTLSGAPSCVSDPSGATYQLTAEESEVIELMRMDSTVRSQILLVMELHKREQQGTAATL